VAGSSHSLLRSQFHQHFTPAFFVQNFGAKNYKAGFGVWILVTNILYKKCVRKMLMKLTPGGLSGGRNNKFFETYYLSSPSLTPLSLYPSLSHYLCIYLYLYLSPTKRFSPGRKGRSTLQNYSKSFLCNIKMIKCHEKVLSYWRILVFLCKRKSQTVITTTYFFQPHSILKPRKRREKL